MLWVTAVYEDALTAEGRKVPFFPRDRRASANRSSKLTALSEQKGRNQEGWCGASLVAQWLRICLPMQGTRVRALVWEDPTCRGATRPLSHNY